MEGRRVSGHESTGYVESDTVQLTDLSVRAIGLYQKQAELTDRLWSYFGSNSAIATLVALAAPIFVKVGWLPANDIYVRVLLALAVVGYCAFTIGNRKALKVSQEALERIAAEAQAASGIKLEVIRPANAILFHRVVSTIAALAMIIGFGIAAQLWGRSLP